jgi:hypothetical protein
VQVSEAPLDISTGAQLLRPFSSLLGFLLRDRVATTRVTCAACKSGHRARSCGRDTDAAVRDASCEAAAIAGLPALHRSRGNGERRASAIPSSTRVRKSIIRLLASPVRIVAIAHVSPHTKGVNRGPNRSPTQPPNTWKSRYG